MNPMAAIGARLALLEATQQENDRLWEFVEDVAHTYGIADVQDVLSRAHDMVRDR